MEANKKLLGEQEANPLIDEIHDKILKVTYLSQRLQIVEDFLNNLITTVDDKIDSITDSLPDEVDDDAEPTPRALKEMASNICNIVEEGGEELKKDINKSLSKIKNVIDIIIELNSPPSLSEADDSNLPVVIPPSVPQTTGDDEDDIEDIEYEDVTDEEDSGGSSGLALPEWVGTLALVPLELAPKMFTGAAKGINEILKLTQLIGNQMIVLGLAVKGVRKMIKCMQHAIHYPTQKLKQAKNVYNYIGLYYTQVNEKIELINKYKNLPNKNKELDNIIIILTTKINKGLISLLEKLMDPNSIDPPESEIGILKKTIQYIFNPASIEELKNLLDSAEKVDDDVN